MKPISPSQFGLICGAVASMVCRGVSDDAARRHADTYYARGYCPEIDPVELRLAVDGTIEIWRRIQAHRAAVTPEELKALEALEKPE